MLEHSTLTIRDVARILQCSERQVRYLVNEGILPKPYKLGRLSRWSHEDLEVAIQAARDARQTPDAERHPCA